MRTNISQFLHTRKVRAHATKTTLAHEEAVKKKGEKQEGEEATATETETTEVTEVKPTKETKDKLKVLSDTAQAYKTLEAELLEYLAQDNTDGAYEVLVTMRRYELKVPLKIFDKVLVNFATNKQVSKVKEVLAFMERDGMPAKEKTHMQIVDAYGKIRQFEWVKNAFIRMTDSVKPSEEAYERALCIFAKEPHISTLRKAEGKPYSVPTKCLISCRGVLHCS